MGNEIDAYDPSVASAAWLQAARRRHLPSFAGEGVTLPYRNLRYRMTGPTSSEP